MKKFSWAIVLSMICVSCNSCNPIKENQDVQNLVEEGVEFVGETAFKLLGEDIDIELDIDPKNHPKCKQCQLHCPKNENAM